MGPRWLERIRLYEHINLCLVLPKSFNSQHWASTLNNYDICIPRQSWSKVVCFLLGRRFPLQTCTRLPGREGGEKLWAHAPKTCLLGGKKLTFCIKSFNTWTAFKKRRTALSTGQLSNCLRKAQKEMTPGILNHRYQCIDLTRDKVTLTKKCWTITWVLPVTGNV